MWRQDCVDIGMKWKGLHYSWLIKLWMLCSNECKYNVSAKQSLYEIKNIIIRYKSQSCNGKFHFSHNCNSHNCCNVFISAQISKYTGLLYCWVIPSEITTLHLLLITMILITTQLGVSTAGRIAHFFVKKKKAREKETGPHVILHYTRALWGLWQRKRILTLLKLRTSSSLRSVKR